MTKKICISGYYGFDNFGDETVLKILIDNLKTYINLSNITVFSVNPKKTAETFNVKSVNTFNPFSVVFSIFKCSYLISGGGSLLQDKTSIKSLIYYLMVFFTAFFFRKKVIIFAQGIGPINNALLKKLTIMFLKHALYISVRDENSLNLLFDNGIKNAEKCFDPVWNINVNKTVNIGKIGVQLRKFPMITDVFINKLALNINKYYSDKEILILSLQNKIDLEVCKKLKNVLNDINPEINVKIIENTSNIKVTEDISSCEAIIAMRYHACLVSVKSGVKLLPVNYDIKVQSLANDFDLICINSENDMDEKFRTFINSDIKYDETKIYNRKYNFTNLLKYIN